MSQHSPFHALLRNLLGRNLLGVFPKLGILALAVLPLGSCYSAPRIRETNTAASRVQNVFAHDLSTSGWLAHFDNVTRHLTGFGAELGRVKHLESGVTGLVSKSQTNFTTMPAKAASLTLSELGHWQRASVPAGLEPNLDRWAHQLADTLANVPRFLGLGRRAMSEPTDREHRTNPHDERPEATLWERVLRRLRL